ncbi:MAG: FeoC-like transcriptional regulator [Thermodesulfobacteriota bacterium]
MDLLRLKGYLKARKMTTLQDIATHFRSDMATVAPMLDIWIGKGKLRKHHGTLGCRKGCCHCDPAAVVTYEWIE